MRLNVLVTGASGQLGKTIKELFSSNSNNVKFSFFSKNELDISNRKALFSAFQLENYHFCINCAAYTNVEQSEKTPELAYQMNAEAVKKLALACKSNSVTLIHISTDYVFDGKKGSPYLISDATNPINEYGKSKLMGENYIQNLMDNYYIIRTSWLFSKKYGNNFYRFIVNQAKEGNKLSITTDQKGSPTDTEDLASYIFNKIIIAQAKYGIYHFTSGKEMTWFEFAIEILKENNLYKSDIISPTKNYKTLASRPKYSVLAH